MLYSLKIMNKNCNIYSCNFLIFLFRIVVYISVISGTVRRKNYAFYLYVKYFIDIHLLIIRES